MLNYIWAFMLLSGILYGAWSGNLVEVSNAILDSSAQAVSLAISMAGVVALWCGLMEIAEEAGVVRILSKLLRPFMGWLFPRLKGQDGEKALEYITLNFIMNILGTGWSATGPGLMAMEELAGINETPENSNTSVKNITSPKNKASINNKTSVKSKTSVKDRMRGNNGKASDEMCTFLVMNISSLQLIPINIIAYRSAYGAASPTAIILPALCTTGISTMAALVFCKIAVNISRLKEKKARYN